MCKNKATKQNEIKLSFGSSHGTVVTDEKGNVLKDLSELSDWLLDIKQIDVAEVREHLKKKDFENADTFTTFDTLHVGYWDLKGKYCPVDKEFRDEHLKCNV
jgi:hypothetical protein